MNSTREIIEVYEKLIEANIAYSQQLVKINEQLKKIENNYIEIKDTISILVKYFKEVGDNNFDEHIKKIVALAVKESNKNLVLVTKLLSAIVGILASLIAILKLI